jgi:predicted metal-dependent enzyme (double-stranded beta helix superfamily)
MTRPLRTLTAIVDDLRGLPPARIDVDTVREILSAGTLDEASLRPFLGFADDHYSRRLVHRSEWFDVMVLSWRPGQVTPVHNHSGQLGWVRLVRGRIEEHSYAYPGGQAFADPATVEIDDDGIGHGVDLVHTGQALVADVGAVATVDRVRAIHTLGNPREHAADDNAVTLHVYSRPHDHCLCFDLQQRTCWQRQLSFDPVRTS